MLSFLQTDCGSHDVSSSPWLQCAVLSQTLSLSMHSPSKHWYSLSAHEVPVVVDFVVVVVSVIVSVLVCERVTVVRLVKVIVEISLVSVVSVVVIPQSFSSSSSSQSGQSSQTQSAEIHLPIRNSIDYILRT